MNDYNYPYNPTTNMNYSTYGNDFTREALERALDLMEEAVQGEREDELKYQYLISVAPSQDEIDIITSIRDDERNHREWFRQMYRYYTGNDILSDRGDRGRGRGDRGRSDREREDREEFQRPESYLQGISDAVFGELGAMEKYRVIREGIPSRLYRDLVLRILTDEMKHATKYNYILTMHSFARGMQY